MDVINRRNVNLNEYSIEEFFLENSYSEIIVKHFDQYIMEKNMLEVEKNWNF